MASDFRRVAIRELVATGAARLQTGPFGSQLHKHDYVTSGIPVIPTEGIGRGRIRADVDFPNVCPEKAAELGRHKLEKGDILFARRGIQATGLSAYVDSDHVGSLCGTGAILLRVDGKQVHPRFLAAYLATEEAFYWLRTHAVGAVMPNLNTEIISELSVPLPSFRIQIDVGKFVASLDDRADLLRQTNATLEAIVQALFKSWFVDFDPVRAKADGREPESMDAATAALFPGEFENEKLGSIPKGWRSIAFGDVACLSKGAVNPLATPEVEFEHYSLPAFDAGQLPVREAGSAIKSNKTPVPSGAVLVSKLNPHIPRIWLVGKTGVNAVCSTEFLVWAAKAPASSAFAYCLASSPPFNSAMRQLVTGTSNSHQRVKPDQLGAIRVCAASDEALDAFATIASPLLQRMLNNRQQAATLAQLRDTLLPRLISGKLRLPEAEREVETVA